jgi:hypothetical protein
MKMYLAGRLQSVLIGAKHDKAADKFTHLTADDRRAILEILRDTKPELLESPR